MSFIQRNYPRIDLRSPVSITMNERVLEGAECINISMGGMCIQVDEAIEQQQKGTVEMEYDCGDEKVTFKGEFVIRWIKPVTSERPEKQFGLQFTYYDSKSLTNLARIIITQVSRDENQEQEK